MGKPCYSFEESNVAITQGFKDQCAFMFFKGALLKDPDKLLEPPGRNSHAARRMMFGSAGAVAALEDDIRGFIAQAIDVEKSGRKVDTNREPDAAPEELTGAFADIPVWRKPSSD